jgi:hypothetical protein
VPATRGTYGPAGSRTCSSWSSPRYVDVGRGSKDFDGDGYADLLVGAPIPPSYNHYPGDHSRVFVYAGSATGIADVPFEIRDPDDDLDANYGWSVSSAGDVNGDGYADAIVGGPESQNYRGHAWVYFGGPDGLPAIHDEPLSSPLPDRYGFFGYAVASAGTSMATDSATS